MNARLKLMQRERWSGGGANLFRNLEYAESIAPHAFDEDGLTVLASNIAPPDLLRSGAFVHIPQNAWAWNGKAVGFWEWRRRTLLRLGSEITCRRAAVGLRIGPMIPNYPNSAIGFLPNVLDLDFEDALEMSQQADLPFGFTEPYWIVPGSLWSYRNIGAVLEAYKRRGSRFKDWKLLVIGPLSAESGLSNLDLDAGSGVVVHTERVSRPEMLAAIAASSGCIFSSLVEASPVTVIEAAALNVPIIAWKTPAHEFICQAERIDQAVFVETIGELERAMALELEPSCAPVVERSSRDSQRDDWVSRLLDLTGCAAS